MEFAGFWETTDFMAEIDGSSPHEFYDSNTGKLLFTAPLDRSWHEFLEESRHHGWLSFRDEEVRTYVDATLREKRDSDTPRFDCTSLKLHCNG